MASGERGQRSQDENGLASVAIHQFHRQQSHDGQRHQVGPEGKALEGKDVKRIVYIRAGNRVDHTGERAQQHAAATEWSRQAQKSW